MKLEYILIILLILYILSQNNNNNITDEHYTARTPYGDPFYYTPVDDIIENFQQVRYKTCAPTATITLYTMSACDYCKTIKPEWNRFVRNIKTNCNFKHLKIEHKKDDEIDIDIEHVPSIRLKIYEKPSYNNLKKVEKTIEYKYDIVAGMLEKFVIENLSNETALEYEHDQYVDCEKGKMYGKFYTACDPIHQKWNTS